MKKIIFDVDDFSNCKPGIEIILKIKEHYPNFKITCFSPSFNDTDAYDKNKIPKQLKKWSKLLEIFDDWIEICPHGLLHTEHEMECSYKEATDIIKSCENIFNKLGIKFKKIWKSPYWQTSLDAYKALKDLGYVVAVDKNETVPLIDGLQYYQYNKCISTPFNETEDIIKAHGHVAGKYINDISLCVDNIMTMPQDAEFLTISEYIKQYGAEKI